MAWGVNADPDAPMLLTEKLVNALYTDAMLLADEARSYFDSDAREDRSSMNPLDRVTFSCESLKVTTRLMHVVAWLLASRDVLAGKAVATKPMAAASQSDPVSIASLPTEAQAIIRASMDLYARISRLERQLTDPHIEPNPALMLRERLERAF
jgi:regulator of CtrA degradation